MKGRSKEKGTQQTVRRDSPAGSRAAEQEPHGATQLHHAEGLTRDGADGAPGAIRGGDVSRSVAKALRVGIGGEKKRGISTILFTRPDTIGVFATDLDNRCHRAPRRGRPPLGWWP